MQQPDLDRIAETGRYAAGLIESVGVAALERSHLWLGNLRGQNLDGTGGGGIGDPTLTAALNRTPEEQLAHLRITAAITAYANAASVVTNLLSTVTPPKPESITADEIGPEWCESCWRNQKRCEPVALHKTGAVKYRGLCRWCGDFRGVYKQLPPLALLKKHHDGRRISTDEIDKALGKRKAG